MMLQTSFSDPIAIAADDAKGGSEAKEVKDTNIRVMVVCPAQTDTPLMRFVDETDSADVIKSAVEKGMLCDPEEVVDQIEKDILTDKIICYPTKEAVYATRIRRFFQIGRAHV